MKSKLIRALAVMGALATGAVVVGVVTLGIFLRSGFSARPEPSGLEAWLALKLRSMAVPDRYERMKNPVAVDRKTLDDAMAHWADHCAVCHANDGSGQTGMGKHMYPRPPDMRKERTQKMSDGALYHAINQGIRFTGMPAWGRPGDSDEETWALVAFIRTLPRLTPKQIEAMAGMNPVSPAAVRSRQEEDDFLSGEGDDKKAKRHEGH